MTLQQQPPEAAANPGVKVFVNRPATVSKVAEPTDQDAVEFLRNRLDRTGPLARRQFLDPSLHLRKAFATGIDLVPAKRIAQKREALGRGCQRFSSSSDAESNRPARPMR